MVVGMVEVMVEVVVEEKVEVVRVEVVKVEVVKVEVVVVVDEVMVVGEKVMVKEEVVILLVGVEEMYTKLKLHLDNYSENLHNYPQLYQNRGSVHNNLHYRIFLLCHKQKNPRCKHRTSPNIDPQDASQMKHLLVDYLILNHIVGCV